jgi:ABC-type transport system substrate-binding protein
MLARARTTFDQRERMALYQAVEHLIAEEVPLLPLAYDRTVMLIKPWVTRYALAGLGALRFEHIVIEPHG